MTISSIVTGWGAKERVSYSAMIVALALVACPQVTARAMTVPDTGMTVRGYQATRHDRFYEGDDKAFIGEEFDWSGVGRTGGDEWVTMISPSYFLSSAHLAPDGNDTVTFYEENDQSGLSHDYVVNVGQQIAVENQSNPTDLWVGKLNDSIADDPINYYPVLDASSAYSGMELYNYGKPDRVGRNELDGFTSRTVEDPNTEEESTGMSMVFNYDGQDVLDIGDDETLLRGGDSGGPSFTKWNDRLALLGIHWFTSEDDDFSGDTFVPAYIDQINAYMDDMVGGESVTVVPEPGTLSLWVIALIGVAWLGRRFARPS